MIIGGITHPVDKNETVISSQKMYILKIKLRYECQKQYALPCKTRHTYRLGHLYFGLKGRVPRFVEKRVKLHFFEFL